MNDEVTRPVTPETGSDTETSEQQIGTLLEAAESPGDAPQEQESEEVLNLSSLAEKAGYDPSTIDNVMVKIKVNGKEEEVTLGEALRGYQRESDYTRSKMALADERRKYQDVLGNEQARITHYLQSLDDWIVKASAAVQNPGVDLDRLRQEDVTEYLRVKDEMQEREQKLLEAVNRKNQLADEQRQMGLAQLSAYVQTQREQLPELIPEWKDSALAEKERGDLSSYLIGDGFTQEEIAQAYDARLIKMARKAMLYDRLQASKPGVLKKIENAPRVQRPGAARSAQDDRTQQVGRDMDRLRKSHDIHDAARVLENLL